MAKQWKQKTWFRAADGTKGSNALVAKKASVTSSTVNNVFTRPEVVLPETRQKVLDAVKNLNYTHNELPTMKMCTVCKVAKPFEDFYDGYKAKNQRDVTNRKYPHSRCKECDHARVRVYHHKNKERITKQMLVSHRRRLYGLNEEEYNDMILSQNNLCAICNKPSDKTLHIDHDHETGRIRGLLCHSCNVGIGLFKEDVDSLASAITYLTSPTK